GARPRSAARHPHLALEPREHAWSFLDESRADLDGPRALGERAAHIVAGVDAPDRDHVEPGACLEEELLETGEVVPHDDDPQTRVPQHVAETRVRERHPRGYSRRNRHGNSAHRPG